MCERRYEYKKRPEQQEHKYATFGGRFGSVGVPVQADWVVPEKKTDHGHQCLPWQFDDDCRKDEGLPRVGFRRALSGLVEGTLGNEVRHDLFNNCSEDSQKQKYREHLVLQALYRVFRIQEGETNK